MTRTWALVATVGLALLGFVGGFLVAAVAGFSAANKPECDGPCFDQWDEAFLIAITVGVAAGLVAGVVTWFKLKPHTRGRDAERGDD